MPKDLLSTYSTADDTPYRCVECGKLVMPNSNCKLTINGEIYRFCTYECFLKAKQEWSRNL